LHKMRTPFYAVVATWRISPHTMNGAELGQIGAKRARHAVMQPINTVEHPLRH